MCWSRLTAKLSLCAAPTAASPSTAPAAREWLAADGDARLPADPALGQAFRCDPSACIARLTDGRLVSQVLTPDAFEEDCDRTAVVVTSREAPPDCKALAIDRKAVRANGAMALRGFRDHRRSAGRPGPALGSPSGAG